MLEEMKKATVTTGAKLPAQFSNTIYDEDTGQMLDYKKFINHNKKKTQEWWQRSSTNDLENR